MLPKSIQEKIDNLTNEMNADNFTIKAMVLVMVYEKGDSFYETPIKILSTAISSKYLKRYMNIFPKDKYICVIENNTSVRELLG